MPKRIIIIVVLIFLGIVGYFIAAEKLTPSWIMGEEQKSHEAFLEIKEQDLGTYPVLGRLLKALTRSNGGEQGVSALVKGTNREGKNLRRFLESNYQKDPKSPYPYQIKYQNKYYDLDILFQFKSPWVL